MHVCSVFLPRSPNVEYKYALLIGRRNQIRRTNLNGRSKNRQLLYYYRPKGQTSDPHAIYCSNVILKIQG